MYYLVDTYSGSTKTGTQSTTFTASVPVNVKPNFTGISLSDLNSAAQNLIPNGNTFIQVISNIKVAFNGAVGSYGSSITGYYAEIVGKNQVHKFKRWQSWHYELPRSYQNQSKSL